jgi:esterase
MAQQLYVRRAGQGPPVVLLHGLFGAGGNLGGLARALQADFGVFSVDLPNHGRSQWLRAPDLPGMANTLKQWMDGEELSQAHVLGHSLGGKVAMQLALSHPQRVASLIVADIAPVGYEGHHDAVFAALQAVADGQCAGREDAARVMADYVQEDAVIQFLLSSLQRNEQGTFDWRFDLSGIHAAYTQLLAAPQADKPYTGPVLFIKGGASDYIQAEHWPAVQKWFPLASVKVMPGCGHWLHVEKSQLFNGIVGRFLVPPKPRMLAQG